MGFLTPKTVSIAFSLALLGLSCASVVAPVPTRTDDTWPGFGCEAVGGTPQGLLIELSLPADLPEDGVIGIFRNNGELGAFQVNQFEDLPQAFVFGDQAVEDGESYQYLCGVWIGEEPLTRTRFDIVGSEAPVRPEAPILTATDDGVLVEWEGFDEVWVTVFRRDVLTDDAAIAVSPALLDSQWVDHEVESGNVYAYYLRAARYVDDLAWESETGPERYVEVGGE